MVITSKVWEERRGGVRQLYPYKHDCMIQKLLLTLTLMMKFLKKLFWVGFGPDILLYYANANLPSASNLSLQLQPWPSHQEWTFVRLVIQHPYTHNCMIQKILGTHDMIWLVAKPFWVGFGANILLYYCQPTLSTQPELPIPISTMAHSSRMDCCSSYIVSIQTWLHDAEPFLSWFGWWQSHLFGSDILLYYLVLLTQLEVPNPTMAHSPRIEDLLYTLYCQSTTLSEPNMSHQIQPSPIHPELTFVCLV